MTVGEFWQKRQALRAKLRADQARLEEAIEAAAVDRREDEVERLTDELQAVVDDLTAIDLVDLQAIVAERLTLPSLPADHPALLAEAQRELEKWQQAQAAAGRAIHITSKVAEGVSTLARLAAKYAKYV